MGELYVQYEYWFATFQLVTAMLGMGATLTARDFADILRAPRAVSLGLGIQLLLIPLVAYLFLGVLGIVGGLAIGFALIAAIPGGTTSNIFTFFARGNSALSICITAITTLACLVSTPLILSLLISDSLPADFSMPTGQIMFEIAMALLLPLSLGMLFLFMYPVAAAQFSKWCIRASLFGILLIVVGSASAGRLDLEAFGMANVALVAGFTLILVVVGASAPRIFGLAKRDAIAVEFEVIVRNTNLGVMLKASLFPASAAATAHLGDTVLFTVLLYGGFQLLIAPVLIRIYTRE
ncbi:bile acid:sodium symporter family protein [Halioglobus maricola]|uniref:Bile acid:sodium symporter family protein n=1 Tax=Halioglobus maricola TaxID=2601894 RepID=A0A5P9NIF5_9GAMM|nr:bile acid:sodium symporter [Halioglobus maricola]QFU75607.1 bile acid:sodium symporter family protein [Halioglobus maricola]